MKTIYKILLTVSFSAFISFLGKAQSDTTLKAISTFSGKQYIGKVLSDDGRELLIETQSIGKIYLPKHDVKNIVKINSSKEIVDQEYSAEGPFTTRYVFTNNALPIRKGENYYMLNLYGPEFHFAVSDRFNIGVMTTWIGSPAILALKYTFKLKSNNFYLSAGTLIGTSGYLSNFRGYGGLHWLSATFGNRKNNVTLSSGYGYIQPNRRIEVPRIQSAGNYLAYDMENQPIIHGPLLGISTIIKIGAKVSFVWDNMGIIYTETKRIVKATLLNNGYYDSVLQNYIAPVYDYAVEEKTGLHTSLIIMPGFRFQNNENKATQFSLNTIISRSSDGKTKSFPLPMISWFRKF